MNPIVPYRVQVVGGLGQNGLVLDRQNDPYMYMLFHVTDIKSKPVHNLTPTIIVRPHGWVRQVSR